MIAWTGVRPLSSFKAMSPTSGMPDAMPAKSWTLWQVSNLNPFGENNDEFATGHGTQKPVELMRRPILHHTERGGIVYDPFLGSGSTLAAAEGEGRICYGLEIDPAYADVIVLRWQKLAGKAAILEGDGRTFEQIRTERGFSQEPEVRLHAAAQFQT
jgi:DNA modification methylase